MDDLSTIPTVTHVIRQAFYLNNQDNQLIIFDLRYQAIITNSIPPQAF